MSKTNKELAVELTKVWAESLARIATNPNVSNVYVPQPKDVASAFSFFYEKLNEDGD
ncbi:hypothetical protein MH117_09955 [Paenibacillus sp. ACRRX]|uniref:hypothetical protein n=1 Tax=Paenibacillus sp. ACRRX TaxID=2918206 RepID=UPI001EF400AC|nr:hypothetical protein [Paenibacillus sp. ACRRX]MCG7407747.1 hypothetical protein [Paenibacillus sp. ACRRX]